MKCLWSTVMLFSLQENKHQHEWTWTIVADCVRLKSWLIEFCLCTEIQTVNSFSASAESSINNVNWCWVIFVVPFRKNKSRDLIQCMRYSEKINNHGEPLILFYEHDRANEIRTSLCSSLDEHVFRSRLRSRCHGKLNAHRDISVACGKQQQVVCAFAHLVGEFWSFNLEQSTS